MAGKRKNSADVLEGKTVGQLLVEGFEGAAKDMKAGKKIKAKAFPRRQPGVMNKLEERFWDMVRDCICNAAGFEIKPDYLVLPDEIRYEATTLKLAKDLRYTPDFQIIDVNGHIWFFETKGFWRDDARAKIKMTAEKFQEYRFVSASWTKKDGWKFEEF